MKKKLLALVLTVVLVAALFVPAVFTSAADEKVVIDFGTMATKTVGGKLCLEVPVLIKENTTNIAAAKFVIVSDQKLPSANSKNGDISDEYEDDFGETATYGFDYTIGVNAKMTADNNLLHDGAYANIVVTSNYDYNGVTTTGTLATLYFELPAGTEDISGYTFSLGEETQVTTQEQTHPAVSKYTEAPACEHVNTDERVTKPATCTVDGIKEIYCVDCTSVLETQTITKLGHDFQFVETVSPSCAAAGYDLYKCSREGCNVTEKRNEVSALDHSYGTFVETVAPTCEAAGYDVYQCDTCTLTTKKNEVAALGHDFSVKDETVAPTCTTAGYDVYKCAHDGCTETEKKNEVAALGHDFSVKGETVSPTETTEGYTEYECSREGCTETTKKDIVPATGKTGEDEKKEESPKNGDTFNSAVCVLAALIAVAGIAVVGKKRFAL